MTFGIHDTSITCSTLFFGDSNSYIVSTSYNQLVVRITRQVRVKAAAFSPTFRALPAKRVSGEKVFQNAPVKHGKKSEIISFRGYIYTYLQLPGTSKL